MFSNPEVEDYEPCACGFDHQYEPEEAREAHREDKETEQDV